MAECTIENHPDFNEPMEIRYTDMDQVSPTLKWVGKILWDNINRIRDIESEIAAIRFAQFGNQWVNEAGMHIDAENGLLWIQLQSEKCALEAGNQRLQENLDTLLMQWQRLASTTTEQFEKYKEYILDSMQNFLSTSDIRIIYFGAQDIEFNPSEMLHTTFVNGYLNSISFFWFKIDDAIDMFESVENYEAIIKEIAEMSFDDVQK